MKRMVINILTLLGLWAWMLLGPSLEQPLGIVVNIAGATVALLGLQLMIRDEISNSNRGGRR